MGFQFLHIDTFARTPGRTGKKQSIANMIAEIEREPDACTHVLNPRQPKLLFGKKPKEVLKLALEQAETAKDSVGRKLRKDAQIIACAVASFPVPMAELTLKDPDLNKWLKLNHEFFKRKYSKSYVSLTAHLDEKFFHIHVLLLPELDNEGVMNIGTVHQGIQARDATKTNKLKIKNRAYKEAMRAFQEEYYEAVGKPCGLTKDGPKRRRLTRQEWTLEKSHAKRLSESIEHIQHTNERSLELHRQSKKLSDEAHERSSKATQLINDANKARSELIKMKANNNEVIRYLKNKAQMLSQNLSISREKLALLESVHSRQKANYQKLERENKSLLKQNNELRRQNDIRAKGLSEVNFRLKAMESMIADGRLEELRQYHITKHGYTGSGSHYSL
ncbi:hypothetical protein K0819_12800 [Vibrio parahaemolyticus]|uniref:plasmid recombination protein n=1 Tax=Vibrio parahaemolyticus TaxID=670 RepID=UPI00234B8D38|nr:hypothetical protein [Vibrio parahaemolyticus]WCM64910.1 hypothetical protein K0819_12800 [Vibrio parahaemolyticus]